MYKKVLVLILTIVMLVAMIPTAYAVGESSATVTIKANKTNVKSGDEVLCSVELQQTGKINTLEVHIALPRELTYVDGSLTTVDKSKLGWDDFSEIKDKLAFSGYGSESYTGTAPIQVATFKVKVNTNTTDTLSIGINELIADNENYETKNPVGIPVMLTVVGSVGEGTETTPSTESQIPETIPANTETVVETGATDISTDAQTVYSTDSIEPAETVESTVEDSVSDSQASETVALSEDLENETPENDSLKNENEKTDNNKNSVIIGIVIGVTFLIVLSVLIICIIKKKKIKK